MSLVVGVRCRHAIVGGAAMAHLREPTSGVVRVRNGFRCHCRRWGKSKYRGQCKTQSCRHRKAPPSSAGSGRLRFGIRMIAYPMRFTTAIFEGSLADNAAATSGAIGDVKRLALPDRMSPRSLRRSPGGCSQSLPSGGYRRSRHCRNVICVPACRLEA